MQKTRTSILESTVRDHRSRKPWSSRIFFIVFVIAAGVLVATQIMNPNKRVLEAIVGLFLLYILWNFSSISAVWILLVIYPFPFSISVGNSTSILILAVFIICLIRSSLGRDLFRFDRRFNLPIILLCLSYLLSLYNQTMTPYLKRFAILTVLSFVASAFLFYMIANFVNDEKKLRKTLTIAMISCAFVALFTLLEMIFPRRILIPGWLYTTHGARLVMKGVRMGGPFKDFELTAEFFALNIPIILLLLARARRLLVRIAYMILFLACVFMLFSTITRGAFISLIAGMVYMAYLFRKDLNIVRTTIAVAAAVALIVAMDAFVSRYTISGSLFSRLSEIAFKSGFIPENRYLAWTGAIERAMKHPIIGNGPGWDFTDPLNVYLWPHNAYLYIFNTNGLFGLFAFLLLLFRLFKATLLGVGSSLTDSPLAPALMKVLHVVFVIFIIDQIKIDYLRNELYIYFIWFLFGLIAATRNVILKTAGAPASESPRR